MTKIKFCSASLLVFIITLIIGAIASSSGTLSPNNNIWHINANGETYGKDDYDSLQCPDLILAINEEGTIGYVKKTDLSQDYLDSLDAVLLDMNTTPSEKKIPMYTYDGTTIIGEFTLK